ncbi:mitotic spindle assembly checkpoint protein MAD1 [Limnoglobus roseus]|nr:hypothetical protein [Limnoglobus roseus]
MPVDTLDAPKLDAKIANPLDQIRGTIRQYMLADAAVTLAIVVVLWFWIGLALDFGLFKVAGFDWVVDAPRGFRLLAQVALVFGPLAVLVIRREVVKQVLGRVSQPWVRRHLLELPLLFHVLLAAVFAPIFLVILLVRYTFWLRTTEENRELALVLEKRFPDVLGDRLITAVELADVEKQHAFGYSADMIRQTIEEARERVGQVPVASVFNWDRIRRKCIVLGVVALGALGLAYAAYAAFGGGPASKFTGEFGDVASIWFERNVTFRNTPWPRKAHIELVGFPDQELRIGKDAASPKVKSRAFKWVVADRTRLHGWRPLMWSDFGDKLPGLAAYASAVVAGGEGKHLPTDARGWDVDRIEAEGADCAGVPELMGKLAALASDSRMTRTVRRLDIPDAMTLSYGGAKTRGRINLNREAGNIFSGEVSGLKESIRFTVKGADFTTTARAITLVPPPMFAKLTRTEYQPAYLYHAPPVREGGKQDFAELKGLRQVLGEKDLSLTGDRSSFSIIQGTEFVLRGVADKPLKHAIVTPKIGKLPGQKTGDTQPITVPTDNDERTQFSLAFRGADRPTANMEFDLTLVDEDDVATTRAVLVQVAEDQVPQVELVVDVLRKQGNSFLVTPIARVPFLTESKVKDDAGLSKVVFAYTYQQVDAAVTVEAKLPLVAGVFAGAPLMPTIAAPIRTVIAAQYVQDASDANVGKTTAGEFPLPRFTEEFAKRRFDTLAVLNQKLTVPQPPDDPQTVRELRFQNQDEDVFNLKAAIPALLEKDASKIQARYRIEMNLLATDTNYETGPKVGQSVEPIRLLVISEAELLVEIAKDEEVQIARLDDVLKKLREAQTKLSQTAVRLRDLAPPPDILVSAGVRAQDLGQDISKARELTTAIQMEYRRLEKEARFNGIDQTQKRIENEILRDLNQILETAFPLTEETHKNFLTALLENRRPEESLIGKDQSDLQSLISQVQALRDKLGEAISLSKIRGELERLVTQQQQSGKILENIQKNVLERLRMPVIATIPTVELAQGEKKTVKNPLNWLAFDGNVYKVKFEAPAGGEVKVPAEVTVADDKDVVEYELTAGNKSGEYTIKLVPSVGNPIEVRVKVK